MAMAAIALTAAAPVHGQSAQPAPYDRAVAAGYKALTLCGGMFNAGRSQAQVEALELSGIYPEYDALVPTLPATVDRATSTVRVPFDPKLPPRFARWQPMIGCTIAPIGADPAQTAGTAFAAPKVAPPDPRPWPIGDAGIAPRSTPQLTRAVDDAFAQRGPRTVGVLVVARGKVAAERYADGFGPFVANRTWSVAKSITGTLAGIGVARGELQVDRPVGFAEWKGPLRGFEDPRGAITLDQLLRMASGLHSATAGNRTDALYFGGTTVDQEATAWPLEARPGTRFRYANNDILLAARAVQAAVTAPQEAWNFAQIRLFAPLGMAHTTAETDWHGNYILSSQVWSTARDLARFGLLYLDDGVWNGARILPVGWVRYVTTPSGPQPEGRAEGYGATFWLLDKSPGVPADTYAAQGNRGQFVVIVPSRQVVIVRRGEDPAGTGNQFDIAKFTARVLAALP